MATLFQALTKKASTYRKLKGAYRDLEDSALELSSDLYNGIGDFYNAVSDRYDNSTQLASPWLNTLSRLNAKAHFPHESVPFTWFTKYKLPPKERMTTGEIGAQLGLQGMPGMGASMTALPAVLTGMAAAPVVGSIAGAAGDSGFLRGGIRGMGAAAGGAAGLGLGSVLADYISNSGSVRTMHPDAQAAITLASLLGGTLGGGYLGYRGGKALSKSRKEKEKEAQEKKASAYHFGGSDKTYLQKLIDYVNAR